MLTLWDGQQLARGAVNESTESSVCIRGRKGASKQRRKRDVKPERIDRHAVRTR